MSEGKQEARVECTCHRRLDSEEWALNCPIDSHREAAARQANQPQEKAQPESGEPYGSFHCLECGQLTTKQTDKEFQRGQQAMAEKAFAGNPKLPEFLDWLGHRLVNVYLESPNVDFVQACHRRANELRSLASAEPSQPESGLPREVGDKFVVANGEMRFLAQVIGRLDDVS